MEEEISRLVYLFTENKDIDTMNPRVKRAVCTAVFTHLIMFNEQMDSDSMAIVQGMDISIFEKIQTPEQMTSIIKSTVSSFLI